MEAAFVRAAFETMSYAPLPVAVAIPFAMLWIYKMAESVRIHFSKGGKIFRS